MTEVYTIPAWMILTGLLIAVLVGVVVGASSGRADRKSVAHAAPVVVETEWPSRVARNLVASMEDEEVGWQILTDWRPGAVGVKLPDGQWCVVDHAGAVMICQDQKWSTFASFEDQDQPYIIRAYCELRARLEREVVAEIGFCDDEDDDVVEQATVKEVEL